MSFATRGGQVVAELGDELKNPGRNIPIACLGGTALSGMLYVLLALPSAGVLPIEGVANQPMSVVAEHITGQAGFVFFVLGRSVIALIGSLNSNFLWGTKALLAAAQDGWFPRRLPDGSHLVEPSDEELARKLGLVARAKLGTHDLVVVGGGPAGLTAGVYAARENLAVLVVDTGGLGGQATTTQRIDNYPGFPDGIGP